MKKNLLALFALGAIYSASAQTTYVKDKAVVAVKPNTLLYMGNGLEVSSSTPNTVINEGNIQINLSDRTPSSTVAETKPYYFRNYISGKTYTDGVANAASDWSDGKNFVNVYNSPTSYGQLMFTAGSSSNYGGSTLIQNYNRVHGKVVVEQPYVNPTNYNNQTLALPFISQPTVGNITNINATSTANTDGYVDNFLPENIMSRFYGLSDTQYVSNNVGNNNRYQSTLFYWDNKNSNYIPVEKGTIGSNRIQDQYTSFILNLAAEPLKSLYASKVTNTANRISFVGTPNGLNANYVLRNGISEKYEVTGPKYTASTTWGEWKNLINSGNEKYISYIGESFNTQSDTSTSYGKWVYNIPNPYTHNVNVPHLIGSTLNINDDILGVQKYGSQNLWVLNVGNVTPRQTNLKATKNTAGTSLAWTGDKEALILKPFEVLMLKMKQHNTAPQYQISNNDNYVAPNGYAKSHLVKTFEYTIGADIPFTAAKAGMSKSTSSASENNLYQLGLSLSNATDNSGGQRMYLVASDQQITGERSSFESEYGDFGSNSGFWLTQETKDGGYDQGSYMFINGFNMNDYVAKPLHLIFYKNEKDSNTKFTLRANLAEGSTENDGLTNFSGGNKFYFVDTKENKVIEVNNSFEYSFTANESSADRFVVYWNELPKTLGTGEAEVNKNKTFIYKNESSSNSIRFEKKNLIANVKVYSMSGQLILSKDNVSTSTDFVMNNISNGMYVITISYSDGTNETLKSLFKR